MKRVAEHRAITSQKSGRACGGGTLREQCLLEENTQWKLPFQLCISVVELGETKGHRSGQSKSRGESLTRSTKLLRDARPPFYFYKTANCTQTHIQYSITRRLHTFQHAMRHDSGQRKTVQGNECDRFFPPY